MIIKSAVFNELSTGELYDILQLRSEVFVVEQDCVYQDVDGKDHRAIHILGYIQEHLAAYARIFAPGEYFDECAIGRVVVSPNHRSGGYGKAIMEAAIQKAIQHFGATEIAVSAQTYLHKFYNDLGFHPIGEEYLEDGIPHIKMIRK